MERYTIWERALCVINRGIPHMTTLCRCDFFLFIINDHHLLFFILQRRNSDMVETLWIQIDVLHNNKMLSKGYIGTLLLPVSFFDSDTIKQNHIGSYVLDNAKEMQLKKCSNIWLAWPFLFLNKNYFSPTTTK